MTSHDRPIHDSLAVQPIDVGHGGSPLTRRAFVRAAIGVGLMLQGIDARAQPSAGVVFGIPIRQSVQDLIAAILRDLRPRYQPDLGERPVYLPGISGAAAMLSVASASPDGSSLLFTSSSSLTLLPALNKLPVDAAEGLLPVVGIGELCYAFIVGAAVPADVKTMADYLRWAQANPGQARYGIPGRGTSPHFIGLEVARMGDVPLKSVGYQGVVPILQDVAKGGMPAAVTLRPSGSDPLDYPTVRVLAVSSGKRWPSLPDVPTLLELGLAESPTVDSVGFFVTDRTPAPKIAELRDAIDLALQKPAIRAAMEGLGLQPMPAGIDYAAYVKAEKDEWRTRVERRQFSVTS